MNRIVVDVCCLLAFIGNSLPMCAQDIPDEMRQLQLVAVVTERAPWGHWGTRPSVYSEWTNHSNRLIPVYTFGGNLRQFAGGRSCFRSESRLKEIFGRLPEATVNPKADYFDQTDIFRLQMEAIAGGKKNVFVMVFDGMDWQTTQAAAIYRTGNVAYRQGRGTGLAFLDYDNAETDFGAMVTSATYSDAIVDRDRQTLSLQGENIGGYSADFGGSFPWSKPGSLEYLICQTKTPKHLVTDSASSATSMFAGIKTYNSAINVDSEGRQVVPLPRALQEKGWAIGVVTSVPISHATPAATYANNADRDDYQDLTRDLLGLPSVSHPKASLSGVDVLIGAGWGELKSLEVEELEKQGRNLVAGNRYLTDEDLKTIQSRERNRYVVAQRTTNKSGPDVLATGVQEAIQKKDRLFGFFGGAHLPFQTADGEFNPTRGAKNVDVYSIEDIRENPTLADCTESALAVLQSRQAAGIWMMVEAGDVDWANHNNNLDDSIGAVFSGEAAFKAIVKWVEVNSNWNDTLLIVTADHGHLLNLTDPEVIARAGQKKLQAKTGVR